MFIQCQGRTSKNQDSFLLVHFKTNSRTTPPRENDIGSDTLITNVIFILYQCQGNFVILWFLGQETIILIIYWAHHYALILVDCGGQVPGFESPRRKLTRIYT